MSVVNMIQNHGTESLATHRHVISGYIAFRIRKYIGNITNKPMPQQALCNTLLILIESIGSYSNIIFQHIGDVLDIQVVVYLAVLIINKNDFW